MMGELSLMLAEPVDWPVMFACTLDLTKDVCCQSVTGGLQA